MAPRSDYHGLRASLPALVALREGGREGGREKGREGGGGGCGGENKDLLITIAPTAPELNFTH